MIALALALHTLSAIVWVGGMFFAHMALRPALGAFEPAERMRLWTKVFPRFFAWVWASVLGLLATGYFVVWWGYGGFAGLPLHINLMQTLGLVMMALYVWLFTVPYRAFKQAMSDGDIAAAADHHARIRRIISINLPLGLVTAALGSSGMLWGS